MMELCKDVFAIPRRIRQIIYYGKQILSIIQHDKEKKHNEIAESFRLKPEQVKE